MEKLRDEKELLEMAGELARLHGMGPDEVFIGLCILELVKQINIKQ